MITTEGFFVIWCQHPHEADVSHSVCFFVVVLNQGDGALGFVLFFVRYTKPSGAFVKKKSTNRSHVAARFDVFGDVVTRGALLQAVIAVPPLLPFCIRTPAPVCTTHAPHHAFARRTHTSTHAKTKTPNATL